ncbi:hypothetical protein HS9_03669 [Bacillus velezensis]|nr:hypothetical protein HS9_03669 [Bacillus velezensis]
MLVIESAAAKSAKICRKGLSKRQQNGKSLSRVFASFI